MLRVDSFSVPPIDHGLHCHAVTVKAKKLLESKKTEVANLRESQSRNKIMGELLAPLSAEQREIMCELMASVKTSKLNESFEKYLPAVIAGKAPQKKQSLMEAKAITGNKVSHSNIKTKRRFLPNLQTKRFFLAEEDRWITLKLSSEAIRTINKNGLFSVVKELRASGVSI